MKDRSKLGARGAPALIAAVFVLVGGARMADADESAGPGHDASADAVPEVTPIPPPAVAVVPSAPTPALSPAGVAPALPASEAAPVELSGAAWFARPRLALSVGEASRSFKLRFFGFLEVDYMTDTTRSYDDSMGTSLVSRTDTYENHHGRTQFSLRSTRLGFGFESPTVGEVTPSAVIESDFAGSQASPPGSTEAVYFDSPLFRIRHAYVKLKSPYIDLLMGHTFDVFGWQSFFDPSGLRNQLFSRNPQLRVSREFNPEGAVTVELAAAAVRPVQRDSGVPDGSAGLRVSFNGWQGIRTPGNERIQAMPLTLAVSGIVRQFKANAFAPPPTQSSNYATGWGVSFDAFLPIIPATNFVDRGNRLALMASFVKGTGIGDLISATGGAQFPTLRNPAYTSPPPLYETANIDQGIVSFDTAGVLHTIDWTAFRVGVQYYLPSTGRWIFSANYTQAHSANMAMLFPHGGKETNLQAHVADTMRYADAKLTFDITPVVRVGVSSQYTQTVYLGDIDSPLVDKDKPHNIRVSAQTIYLF
ncbi:MAG TPA: hypothetical protein VF550_09615 [Polyangia bacterium]